MGCLRPLSANVADFPLAWTRKHGIQARLAEAARATADIDAGMEQTRAEEEGRAGSITSDAGPRCRGMPLSVKRAASIRCRDLHGQRNTRQRRVARNLIRAGYHPGFVPWLGRESPESSDHEDGPQRGSEKGRCKSTLMHENPHWAVKC